MNDVTHTPWHVNNARTADGEFMICGGEGQEYGLIATVAELTDADDIVFEHNDRPALLLRIEVLEAALRPFAAEADRRSGLCLGLDIDHWSIDGVGDLTLGDLRKARAALSTVEAETGRGSRPNASGTGGGGV